MDWDKLRIFHMVAEAGSFTHAGETLKLSQSAVSRHISALEETLGVSLFHRHARGLILTEQGELLHKTSRDIFGKLAMIEGQLHDTKDEPSGPITVTVAEFIGTGWLAPHLKEFCTEHPKMQVRMIHDDRVLNLGMREADVAIRLYKPEQQDLIQRQIASVGFTICAGKKYKPAKGLPKKLEDLRDHAMVAYPEQILLPFQNPNWLFERANIEIDGNPNVIQINSISGMFQAVKGGAGIAVLPTFMVKGDPDMVPIMEDITCDKIDMYFVYPEERKHSKRIALFRDFVLKLVDQTSF
jgi:DNA-binding transcriptional LysR family regulator